MKRRPLPEFKSERELVRFLDNPATDVSAYDWETFGEPAEIDIDEDSLRLQEVAEYGRGAKLRPVTMRLDDTLVRALKRIAFRKRTSYQTLARMWLRERALEELRAKMVYPIKTSKGEWARGVSEQTRSEQLLSKISADLKEVRRVLKKRST